MNNEDQKPILAISKDKSDSINTSELLEALKGELFSTSTDQAPIAIQSDYLANDIHLLKIIYKCGNSNTLNFIAGSIEPNDIILDENSVVYLDYTHSRNSYVSRAELIEMLTKFINKNGDTKIYMMTSDDGFSILTQVFKCSDKCPSVHLS